MSAAHSGALDGSAIIVKVGSRVTCNPPPTDTDEDYLVYVDDLNESVRALLGIGFEYSSTPEQTEKYMSMGSPGCFTSLWFGDLNYIVTSDALFFERFLTATHVCKKLNLMNKEDRILVFSAIRGESYSHEVDGGVTCREIAMKFQRAVKDDLDGESGDGLVRMEMLVHMDQLW
jgi:hypothetical protein